MTTPNEYFYDLSPKLYRDSSLTAVIFPKALTSKIVFLRKMHAIRTVFFKAAIKWSENLLDLFSEKAIIRFVP